MTARFLELGTKIKIVTPVAEIQQSAETGMYARYQNDVEYVVVGYQHWSLRDAKAEARPVPRLDLAEATVIESPFNKKCGSELYFQNPGQVAYIVHKDLRRVQVEVLGPTLADLDPAFTQIAIKRDFLPKIEEKRPGFSPVKIELVKDKNNKIAMRLKGERGVQDFFQPYEPGIRHRSSGTTWKVPPKNFKLDVVNGPK